jgi:hypothetical protein
MAVPYNLMHILIDDGIANPGSWWYPSPHYMKDLKPTASISRKTALETDVVK